MKRKSVCITLVALAAMLTAAGCGSSGRESGKGEDKSSSAPKEAVVIIEGDSIPNGTWNLEYLKEKLPDVKFVNKTFDNNTIEKTIKTAFTAGESIDLSMYWPNKMQNFLTSDMALDLTPYLEEDPEWKDSFVEGALDVGTYDGKVYPIPDSTVYPLIEVNTAILEEAGVEVQESWTWGEFMDACAKIKENTKAFPIGIRAELANWTVRNGLLQVWDSEEELESFNAGEISFTDKRVVDVFEKVAELYDNYCYPGEGAISVTGDEVNAAFANGDVAMVAEVNSMAKKSIENSGLDTVRIVSWPMMGSGELDYILGGCTGYFIPSNVKDKDLSVEMLKLLTSQEVFEHAAENGTVTPVETTGGNDDPNAKDYARDSGRVYPTEIMGLSSELFDYITQNVPANYLFYGDQSLEEMDTMRKAAEK